MVKETKTVAADYDFSSFSDTDFAIFGLVQEKAEQKIDSLIADLHKRYMQDVEFYLKEKIEPRLDAQCTKFENKEVIEEHIPIIHDKFYIPYTVDAVRLYKKYYFFTYQYADIQKLGKLNLYEVRRNKPLILRVWITRQVKWLHYQSKTPTAHFKSEIWSIIRDIRTS